MYIHTYIHIMVYASLKSIRLHSIEEWHRHGGGREVFGKLLVPVSGNLSPGRFRAVIIRNLTGPRGTQRNRPQCTQHKLHRSNAVEVTKTERANLRGFGIDGGDVSFRIHSPCKIISYNNVMYIYIYILYTRNS